MPVSCCAHATESILKVRCEVIWKPPAKCSYRAGEPERVQRQPEHTKATPQTI
jgi:hypothetical protein